MKIAGSGKIHVSWARTTANAAKRPTPATASAMNLSMVFVSVSAASARSRFHPQRAQKGLLERAKNWRSCTEEPQRGQVIPFTKIILVDLFSSEEGEFRSSCFVETFCCFEQ